jgi:hypothetical protein
LSPKDVLGEHVETKHTTQTVCKQIKRVIFDFPGAKRAPKRRKRWIKACRRGKSFTCKKDSYICSIHFVGGNGPTNDIPDPIPAKKQAKK